MGDEVPQGGGCGIDEQEPEVVTEVYEATAWHMWLAVVPGL